jgi:hypothetical protein
VSELRVLLGQSGSRIHRVESELQSARSQVAWFTKQVFGQKAERISKTELLTAFQTYVKEEEDKRQRPGGGAPLVSELASSQLLLGFLHPTVREDAPPIEELHEPAPGSGSTPEPSPPPPPAPKKGHGRKRLPITLREETIVLRPEHVPEGAMEAGAEVSYRVGVRRAELVRIAIVRPKYETLDEDTGVTKTVLADPPDEMTPRGLLGPSALAHSRHRPQVGPSRAVSLAGAVLQTLGLRSVAEHVVRRRDSRLTAREGARLGDGGGGQTRRALRGRGCDDGADAR